MRKTWRGPLLLVALMILHASSSEEHEICRLVRTDNLKEICRSTPAGVDLVKFIIWRIEFEICSCSDEDKFLMKIAVPGAENLNTPIWDGKLTQARSNEQSKFMYGQFTSDTISVSNFTKYYKDRQAHIFIYPTSAVDQGNVSLPSASLFVSCKIILTS